MELYSWPLQTIGGTIMNYYDYYLESEFEPFKYRKKGKKKSKKKKKFLKRIKKFFSLIMSSQRVESGNASFF